MTPLEQRLAHHLMTAADYVFLNGSTPWDVDEAMEALGFQPGPYLAEDAVGLDASGAGDRPGPLVGRMFALGKLGHKTGAGWYRYPGGGGAVEDPIVADLALEEAHFAGLRRTDYAPAEIQDRLLLALFCVGSDAVATGLAKDWEAVDRAAEQACRYPFAVRGPVLTAVDLHGPQKTRARLLELGQEAPSIWWLPSELNV